MSQPGACVVFRLYERQRGLLSFTSQDYYGRALLPLGQFISSERTGTKGQFNVRSTVKSSFYLLFLPYYTVYLVYFVSFPPVEKPVQFIVAASQTCVPAQFSGQSCRRVSICTFTSMQCSSQILQLFF